MDTKMLNSILKKHSLWLLNSEKGERADLTGARLSGADLTGARLSGARLSGARLTGVDLTGANLTEADLTGARLTRANLTRANLNGAYLTEADLTGANLTGVDLTGANLTGVDLTGANLDFSSGIPFHCGGTNIIGDDRLFSQILYHLTRQNWENLPAEKQVWLSTIPEDILNGFCKYRNDIK